LVCGSFSLKSRNVGRRQRQCVLCGYTADQQVCVEVCVGVVVEGCANKFNHQMDAVIGNQNLPQRQRIVCGAGLYRHGRTVLSISLTRGSGECPGSRSDETAIIEERDEATGKRRRKWVTSKLPANVRRKSNAPGLSPSWKAAHSRSRLRMASAFPQSNGSGRSTEGAKKDDADL